MLLCIAVWMLAYPYKGIFHDANLYTLQALARLHTDSLAQDVFLHFGSQDRFTVFSPAYAAAIRLLGVDHAAALLTGLSQWALIVAAWSLARAIMPARYALLGAALVLAMPGDYGPGRIFTCIEPFLTPRMGAEACTLAAVASAFAGRRSWSLIFIAAACALHPVMAAGGVVLLIIAFLVLPRPAWGAVLAKLGGIWILLSAYAMSAGQWGRLDAEWLSLATQRSPYLFLSFWNIDDWSRAAVTLTVLLIGAFTLEPRARLLCRAAALTMIGGLALTGLACDTWHLTLFTQAQPWRWHWVATIAAAVTLPLVVISRWSRGLAARCTALLLLGAWIFGAGEYAVIASACALLSLCFGRLNERQLRLLFCGSCGLLGLALLWRLASSLEFTDVHYMDAALPLSLRRATSLAHDGVVPAALIGVAAWMLNLQRAVTGWRIVAAFAILGIGVLLPFAWQAWSREEFSQAQMQRFAAWQQIIAPGDDVFWGESPVSSWVLLNRPNYLSAVQTAGMIFSRQSALEMERRALLMRNFIGPQTFLDWSSTGAHLSLSAEQLQGICRLQAFGYLVSNTDLGMSPVAVSEKLKLYRCAPQARAAAAAT